MSITGALFSGVSGINANGNPMNVIGDNIANVNTIGFKSSRAVFSDLLSAEIGGTKIGLGSRLATSERLFTQGGVETTNSATNLAIQGNGLFVLKDSQGASFYSRAGEFSVDKNGNLTNPAGLVVQGVQLDGQGTPVSGVGNIVISQAVIKPAATDTISTRRSMGPLSLGSGRSPLGRLWPLQHPEEATPQPAGHRQHQGERLHADPIQPLDLVGLRHRSMVGEAVQQDGAECREDIVAQVVAVAGDGGRLEVQALAAS